MPFTSLPERRGEILCVGELLWDALPAGLFLGGAPFNVACHLRAAGAAVTMVTRVGNDQLGDEARRRVARFGVSTDLVQVDTSLPTGFVRVTVADDGNAAYDILEPAAWDNLETTRTLLDRADAAQAVVFGTLAQRGGVTRDTLRRILDTRALKVLDVNLRPPYDDRRSRGLPWPLPRSAWRSARRDRAGRRRGSGAAAPFPPPRAVRARCRRPPDP